MSLRSELVKFFGPALTLVFYVCQRCSYTWRTTEWSDCRVDLLLSQQDRRRSNVTGLCGGGLQTREVYCVQANAELLKYLNNLREKEKGKAGLRVKPRAFQIFQPNLFFLMVSTELQTVGCKHLVDYLCWENINGQHILKSQYISGEKNGFLFIGFQTCLISHPNSIYLFLLTVEAWR